MTGKLRQKDGFTLLEMLVALSVVAIIGGLMTVFLGQLGSLSRLEEEIAVQTELNAAAAYLQRLLEGTRPVRLLGARQDTNLLFEGGASEIHFGAVTRRGIYSLALRDVHVFVSRSGGRLNLVHTLAPRRTEDGRPVSQGTPIPILDDVNQVRFEYSDGGGWQATWSELGAIPSLVKIEITRSVGRRNLQAVSVAKLL